MKGIARRALGGLHTPGPDEVVNRRPTRAEPKDALVQNYLPVHPGGTAPPSTRSFETRSVRDRETGRITYGERDDDAADRPPRGGHATPCTVP
jgi:hypothetical protein